MRVGYVRVSTEGQNTERQEETMARLNVEKVFMDKVSGKDVGNRKGLQDMLAFVREGDVLVVDSISRLARNVRDLLKIVDYLKEKSVEFVSVKESVDTSTPQGMFVLTIWGAMAEMEREFIRERAKEGIEIAKREGKYRGREPIAIDEDDFKKYYGLWKSGKITAVQAMNSLGIKNNTFYRRVKAYEGAK